MPYLRIRARALRVMDLLTRGQSLQLWHWSFEHWVEVTNEMSRVARANLSMDRILLGVLNEYRESLMGVLAEDVLTALIGQGTAIEDGTRTEIQDRIMHELGEIPIRALAQSWNRVLLQSVVTRVLNRMLAPNHHDEWNDMYDDHEVVEGEENVEMTDEARVTSSAITRALEYAFNHGMSASQLKARVTADQVPAAQQEPPAPSRTVWNHIQKEELL